MDRAAAIAAWYEAHQLEPVTASDLLITFAAAGIEFPSAKALGQDLAHHRPEWHRELDAVGWVTPGRAPPIAKSAGWRLNKVLPPIPRPEKVHAIPNHYRAQVHHLCKILSEDEQRHHIPPRGAAGRGMALEIEHFEAIQANREMINGLASLIEPGEPLAQAIAWMLPDDEHFRGT